MNEELIIKTDIEQDNNSIIKQVKLLKKEILLFKIKKSYDDFKDTSKIKKNKKKIARLMTKLNSK